MIYRIATENGYSIRPDMTVRDGYGRTHRLEIQSSGVLTLNMFDRKGRRLMLATVEHGLPEAAIDASNPERLFEIGGAGTSEADHQRICIRGRVGVAIERALEAFEDEHPDLGDDLPPLPGHAVLLKEGGRSWFVGCEGKQGMIGGAEERISSVFFGPIAHQDTETAMVSLSGGPGTICAVDPSEFTRHGDATVCVWRWRNRTSGAGNDCTRKLRVARWIWDAGAYEARLARNQ